MPKEYNSTEGQSVLDVCISIYGTSDYIYKLMQDSGIDNLDYIPKTGDVFIYDTEILKENRVPVKYSTLANITINAPFNE